MTTLRELLQRREQIRTELHTLFDKPDIDDAAGETRKRADALETELSTLGDAERRQKLLDDLDRTRPGLPLGGGGPGATELRMFDGAASVPRPEAFDGVVLRRQDGSRTPVLEHRHRLVDFLPPSEDRSAELGIAGYLRALHRGPQTELERRALAEGSVGAGGAMVPVPLAAEMIDAMRARSVTIAAGARVIPMTSQTERFARIVADPVGAWRLENAPIIEDQPTFDNVLLTAHSWALLVKVSRELLEDATNLDAQLRNVFGAAAGLALDQALLFGSGTTPVPRGISNVAGIQMIDMGAVAGAVITDFNPLLDGLLQLQMANATGPFSAVMSPRTARAFGGLQDTTHQPLVPPASVAAISRFTTTAVPVNEAHGTAVNSSSILMGDFSQCFIGMRTALQISTLSERYADTGQIGFVLWLRADVQLAHVLAFTKVSGIIP